MGKHRLRYKIMKFPTRQNGTLIPDQDSESDVQEFALPKKRVVKPSGKNPYVARRRPGCCRTCASIILSLILIASILCVVVLGWFSLRLKRDLNLLKRRLAEVETSDRSTSKECADRGEELQKKLEALRGTTAGLVTTDDKRFKSLLKRFSILNKTVTSLHKRLKSPKSVSSIHNDISLLKKAMADTGREMTEVTDKVTQLRRIARLQNNNIKHLKVQMYNVTVQLAKLTGKPTPRPVINTGTPPWLLRVPADSNSQSKPKTSQLEMERVRKNITSYVKKDIGKIVAYVKRANKTVHRHVHNVQENLSALVKNFDKHKALMEKLIKKSKQDLTKENQTTVHHSESSIEHEISNLTHLLDTLTSQFGSQNKRFEELSVDVTGINGTLHRHIKKSSKTTAKSCNCSLDSVWKILSKDEDVMKTLQSKIDEVHKSVEQLHLKKTSPTLSSPVTTIRETNTTRVRQSTEKTPTKPEETRTGSKKTTTKPAQAQTSTDQPTTQQSSTVHKTDRDKTSQTNKTKTTQVTPVTPSSKTDKRMIDDDDDDLNSWGDDGDDQSLPDDQPESRR